jgi:hypothetical protein
MDMMSTIKDCTERVLTELTRSERINLLSIAGHLGERSMIVYESIGWLAHEGRINFQQEGNQVYVSLAKDGQ